MCQWDGWWVVVVGSARTVQLWTVKGKQMVRQTGEREVVVVVVEGVDKEAEMTGI